MQTLAITGPIYLVIALGYLAVRHGVFTSPDMRVLGTYVVRFALPALIFTSLSQQPVAAILDGRYLLDYAVASLTLATVSFCWGRFRQRKGVALSVFSGLGMASSNSGFVGYPIAVQVVGQGPATVALAMCMVVENLLMIPLTLAVAEGRGEGGPLRALARSAALLARNPMILAMLGGFGVALVGVPVSSTLARTVNMLALSSTAVALFVIGGSLHGLNIRGMRKDVGAIALGKLLLHPLLVGLMVWLVPPADRDLRAAAVLFASMPMLSIYPILAQRFGFEHLCAAALLLATVLSFFTISGWLWLLGGPLGRTG